MTYSFAFSGLTYWECQEIWPGCIFKGERGKDMSLRLTKVNEFQFLTCLKHEVWGSNQQRFGKWGIGERLAFLVGTNLAALAEISGEAYMDDEIIWDNGLFPYRIPIAFSHVMLEEHRPSIRGAIQESFLSKKDHWINYGSFLSTQSIISERSESLILAAIRSKPNDLQAIRRKIEHYLTKASEL